MIIRIFDRMDTVVIHPKTKEQLAAVKAFAKALKMEFEITQPTSQYDPEFVKKILDADKSAKKGNVTRIKDAKNIWADIL
ncbi:hypothetical protein C5745_00405 [Sphingobacterium haloxyli]|uniref:Uncharacterized protein n=2 Tax=Sphingobacterium haloxyli TaxID=2100533 RepID=A0A2S9J8P8_9SPHI|nr:hypothetical protein C5745_00405 [Sphingobacterium haloxyli]